MDTPKFGHQIMERLLFENKDHDLAKDFVIGCRPDHEFIAQRGRENDNELTMTRFQCAFKQCMCLRFIVKIAVYQGVMSLAHIGMITPLSCEHTTAELLSKQITWKCS